MGNNQKELLIDNADFISNIMIKKFGNINNALNHVNQINFITEDKNAKEFWDKIENNLKNKNK